MKIDGEPLPSKVANCFRGYDKPRHTWEWEPVAFLILSRWYKLKLGGGFKHYLFSPLFGEMTQFDDGLKPPSRKICGCRSRFRNLDISVGPPQKLQQFCLPKRNGAPERPGCIFFGLDIKSCQGIEKYGTGPPEDKSPGYGLDACLCALLFLMIIKKGM